MMLRALLPGILAVLLLCSHAFAQQRSALAPVPDWTKLEAFQETITHDDFLRLLNEVYAPNNAARDLIVVSPDAAEVKTTLTPPATWTLRFAPTAEAAKPVPRFWRPAAAMSPAPTGKPLAGVKIAIDPGHIGGEWARMEERYFRIGESVPVMEGEMTLHVARLLVPQLQAMGAETTLVRNALEPVTPARPETLRDPARDELLRSGNPAPRELYDGPDDPKRGGTVQWESELLFYRISEIRHRAEIVNDQIKPDLTICLHFNAEAWGDPRKPEFVPRNHFHALLNGCYSAAELQNDDVRFEMLSKLLGRCFSEELAASTTVADVFAQRTGLPPYTYNTPNAIREGTSAYVWARNLLANRLYHTPVIFLEPYVMNCEEVWQRVQAGEYQGEQMIAGKMRKDIFHEYADSVAAGLHDYFAATRPAR